MQDTYVITPHIIERWQVADKVEVAGVTHPEADERALLMFTGEDQAKRFRTATGKFPAREGFEVVYVDVDGLRNIIRTWGYSLVAVVGLEPASPGAGGGARFFDAETFCEMLEQLRWEPRNQTE